jgi:periplasmic protein TonB
MPMEPHPTRSSARPAVNDRLGSTLFLAALVHGVVILGVTFSVATFDDDHTSPSLNVTLLVDGRDEPAPDKADFIANRNQQAAGTAANGLHPTNALSAKEPIAQAGSPDGADLTDGTPRELVPSAEELVSRGPSEPVNATRQPTDDPADTRQKALALVDEVAPQTTAAELGLRAELPSGDDDRRTLIATPSAQQSILAEYLDGWRRRVERIGTANYPARFLGGPDHGRPTLEVTIRADGSLKDIVVRRSSGDKALDQAALNILRLAAPFDPLPQNVRKDYDVLRFAYDWDFFDSARKGTARVQRGDGD